MASRRVAFTQNDLRAALAEYAVAAAVTPPMNRAGVMANRAKTCCPRCGGAYVTVGDRRVCKPCRTKTQAARRRIWMQDPANRARHLRNQQAWRARQRAAGRSV